MRRLILASYDKIMLPSQYSYIKSSLLKHPLISLGSTSYQDFLPYWPWSDRKRDKSLLVFKKLLEGSGGRLTLFFSLTYTLWQCPVRTRVMAGVAAGIALKIILMLGLCLPEIGCRFEFRYRFARP